MDHLLFLHLVFSIILYNQALTPWFTSKRDILESGFYFEIYQEFDTFFYYLSDIGLYAKNTFKINIFEEETNFTYNL